MKEEDTREIKRKFRLGKRICDDLIHDYIHPENSKYEQNIHDTRIDAMGHDFWEGLGYMAGVVENTIKHPITMYNLFGEKRK